MVGKEEESTALDMKDYTALRARFQHACVTSSHYATLCYAATMPTRARELGRGPQPVQQESYSLQYPLE